ncbi:MAG: YncE family protein, partial [Anaerolineae bacterium]
MTRLATIFGLNLLLLTIALGGNGALSNEAAQSPDATITSDASRPGAVKDVIEVSGVLAPEDTVAYYLTTSLPSQTPTPTATATPTPTATSTATPTPTATSSPIPAVTSTPTPPAPQCAGDANANGIGDVVDVMTAASEPGCRAYLPLVVANWRQPWPTTTPTPSPTQACECAGPGGCGATPTPQQTLSKLAMVEANEYWIAYESPTQYALSLAWAGDSLWMADVFKGVFYKVQEGEDGLTIIDTVKVRRDPFMQARDLAWDGDNLWSVHWGDLIRHDMTDPNLGADLWINEGEIGAPNLHHLKAIAWDGEFIWSALDGTIYRHNKTDFEVAETFQVSGTFSPAGMAFRGGDLWVANRSGGFIDRLDSNSFTLLDRYSIVQQPFGLAWSDSNLWVYDWYTNR